MIASGGRVYEDNGPFAYFKASKGHVTLGFWRGADLDDPVSLLEGTGSKMRHVKLPSSKHIPKTQLEAMVRQAVRLNRTKGDPTRGR